jgi:hypothetical protein
LLLSLVKFTHAPLQRVYPLLHVKEHALLVHCAAALAMLVEHALPQVPQSFTLLVVSTQLPLQRDGVADGQPETHVDPAHTGVPPLHACVAPQPPQLLTSLVKFTHAPLQRVYPLLHVKLHALPVQLAVALATAVVHAWPHVLQLLTSLVVSTQLPLQSVGATVGQPDAHAYEAVAPTQTGVVPVQSLPQVPQLLAVVS